MIPYSFYWETKAQILNFDWETKAQILNFHSEGTYGIVYRAKDKSGQIVALKV